MKNTEYHECFNNCIENNTMTIKKYIPVTNYLIKIFTHYKNSGVFDYSWYNDKGIDLQELDLIKRVLKLFSRIMKDKKYEQLDEYIDFLLTLDVWYDDFITYLEMFIYKYVDNIDAFNDYLFSNLLFKVIRNVDYVNSLNSSSRPINIMQAYARYYKISYESNITEYEREKREFYKKYAKKIITHFHYSDIDVKYLYELLDSMSYDYESIKNYLIGNNPNNDSFEEYHLIEDLLDKYKGTKKLIK